MAIRFDRLQNLSSVFASLSLVAFATVSCGDSPEKDKAVPAPSDAGTVQPDALGDDGGNPSGDDGAAGDAASEAGSDDTSTDAGSSFDATGCTCTASGGVGTTSLPWCQPVSRTIPCGGDAADDTDVDSDAPTSDADADIDCSTCTPDEQGVLGIKSLSCFCANWPCPSFDVAMANCPSGPVVGLNRLQTYGSCNLVVVVASNGLGSSQYVYDATTHEFLGGTVASDYPSSLCGTTAVFGYRAGTFPAETCALTQSENRCQDAGSGN